MKILVTGTAGFIGFHVVRKMIGYNVNIVGIDSINDYYDVNLKYGRLDACGISKKDITYGNSSKSKKYNNYVFIQLNIEDEHNMNLLFEEYKFDIVIHLAAQAGVRYSLENPHAYIKSNVEGFLNILECCKKNKVKHLVYASSSSVYGLNRSEIFSTKDAVNHPISLYAATKRSNELMAHVYSHLYELPVTGLRFFTVYGPWGRPDMAPMLFAKAILDEKPISVYNYGDMKRDFTYVDDIVEGIIKITFGKPPEIGKEITKLLPDNSVSPFKIYNIGNQTPVKLADFISILEKELGKNAEKNYLPMQPGDVYSTYADIGDLILDFDYQPNTTLEKGIGDFVKWYKSFYNL